MVTCPWSHLFYNSRGAWQCMPCTSQQSLLLSNYKWDAIFIYSQFHDNIYIQVYTCANGLDVGIAYICPLQLVRQFKYIYTHIVMQLQKLQVVQTHVYIYKVLVIAMNMNVNSNRWHFFYKRCLQFLSKYLMLSIAMSTNEMQSEIHAMETFNNSFSNNLILCFIWKGKC